MRNLKIIGLALVAVLALSAMFASAASANPKFTAASYPQTLTTEDTGEEDLFTVSGSELTCSAEQFTGELKEASSELTVTPHYNNCKTKGAAFNNVTVTTNNCTFIFTANTTVGKHGAGPVRIACPGSPIEIHHYSTAHNHTTNVSSCTVTVGSQTAQHHLTYSNPTKTSVLISGTVTVTAQTHGACSFGLTVNTTSEYHTSTTAKAASGAEIHVK